jgi:hypothetical protein
MKSRSFIESAFSVAQVTGIVPLRIMALHGYRPMGQSVDSQVRKRVLPPCPFDFASIMDSKVGFRPLKDGWADTTIAHVRLMLTVLGGLAEFEREPTLAHMRESEGSRQESGRSIQGVRVPAAWGVKQWDRAEALTDNGRCYNVCVAAILRQPA